MVLTPQSTENTEDTMDVIAGTLPLPTETRRKPRAPRGKSASDWADALSAQVGELGERIRKANEAEVRYYLGEMLRALAEDTEPRIQDCQLAGEKHPVTDDYRAALRFAAALVADPDVDD